MIYRMKKTQIGKHCYVASLTGMLIVASNQLTTLQYVIKQLFMLIV